MTNNFKTFIEEVKKSTGCNDHNGAYTLIASKYGTQDFLETFQSTEGHASMHEGISEEISKTRYKVYKSMMAFIKENHGEYIHHKIYISV